MTSLIIEFPIEATYLGKKEIITTQDIIDLEKKIRQVSESVLGSEGKFTIRITSSYESILQTSFDQFLIESVVNNRVADLLRIDYSGKNKKIRDIVMTQSKKFMEIKGFGRYRLANLLESLHKYGLRNVFEYPVAESSNLPVHDRLVIQYLKQRLQE